MMTWTTSCSRRLLALVARVSSSPTLTRMCSGSSLAAANHHLDVLQTLIPGCSQDTASGPSPHPCQPPIMGRTGRGVALAAAAAASCNNLGPNQHQVPQQANTSERAGPSETTEQKQSQQDAAGCHVQHAWDKVLQLLNAGPINHHTQQEQLDEALEAAASSSTALPAQQLLALLAAALHAPQPQLVSMLTHSAIASLPQLTPHQFAAALSALHTLQTTCEGLEVSPRPAPATDAAPLQRHNDCQPSSQHSRAGVLLDKAVRAYLQQHQQAMDASSTAAAAAALAASQQHNSFTILAMLALEHMQHMTPAQLVQLLTAFADVQHYNQAVCDAAAGLAVAIIKRQGFKLLQAPETAAAPEPAATSAAAGIGTAAPAATETAASQATCSTQTHSSAVQQQQQQQQQGHTEASGFTAGQLVSVLHAVARLRHYAPDLLEAACACLLKCPQRTLDDVVALLHTCALLNHYHVQLCEVGVAMAQQAMKLQQPNAGGSLPRVLAVLCWSCGVMGHWDQDFLQQVFAWSGQVEAGRLSTQELLQWHEVQSSLTDVALLQPQWAQQQSPVGLSSSLLVAAQGAWLRRQQSRRLTAFQKEVVEALQQAGVRCRLNVALDGPVVVDVALTPRQVGARYRVALQLHPHEDFAANPPHGPLGPTAARWRALQARGWRVVALQQSEWRRLKTQQQRVEYAWQLSQGVEVSAPGMSHLVHQVEVGKPEPGRPSLPQTLWRILLEGH